jgi:transglutaminase-like putative cysteine protease
MPLTRIALRIFGYRRWQRLLFLTVPGIIDAKVTDEIITEARRTARLVRAAGEGIVKGSCLEQSVVLWWLLRRQRRPCELRIGVRMAAAGFEAHAWVEVGGKVVNDSEDVRQDYAPFEQDIAKAAMEWR